MIPALLITLREVIEATLIVATILGILVKLKNKPAQKIVYLASASALGLCTMLLIAASFVGFSIQTLYTGVVEDFTEGVLMTISAIFITWAVFFLHKHFSSYKVRLLQKISHSLAENEKKGLFALTFTAVFREGFEIILFLSTIYLSSNPFSVLTGAFWGLIIGLAVSFAFFSATLRMPVYYTFRVTSILLIFFAAGLLGRGMHEFADIGLLPNLGNITISFVPHSATIIGSFLKSIFGITTRIDGIQAVFYISYVLAMFWLFFWRKKFNLLRIHL